jgi:hypothetical protein
MPQVIFPEATPDIPYEESKRIIIAEFTKLNPTLILTEDLKDVFVAPCHQCGYSKRRRIHLDWIEEGPRKDRAEVLIKAWQQDQEKRHGKLVGERSLWAYDILQCIYCAGHEAGRDLMIAPFAKAIEGTLEPL